MCRELQNKKLGEMQAWSKSDRDPYILLHCSRKAHKLQEGLS